MVGQSQIRTRLSQSDSIERVQRLLAENPDWHRTALADRLCDEFGFLDARSRRQRAGCLKALRVLEGRGHFALPEPRVKHGPPRPRRLESEVPPPRNTPDNVGDIRGLEIVLVETEEQMRSWNSLFLDEHPQGAGPLVGRQLRYLIASEHGWLGGFGFASAALQLEARDRWIGWDLETRRAHLERVVGMSRFLIRPSVTCKNLASRVLSLVMERMPQDFEARYGYQPWLVETFVDTSKYAGTCYRAANWTRLGSSRGRGRQDREREHPETVKDIYAHVLVKDFRARIGLPEQDDLGPLPLDELGAETWVEREFGGAPLGDERLSKRLVQCASTLAKEPMSSFPSAAKGNRAMLKGYYRLIDRPDESAVIMENILLPHREQTVRRMKAHPVVLCIQDGSTLDYNGTNQCEGLEVTGSNQTKAKSLGLPLHSTLVVTDEGLPLGVLRSQCRTPLVEGAESSSDQPPPKQKKSCNWLNGLRDCEVVAAEMPDTCVVQVMDREADFFELFDVWHRGPRRTHLLVRAYRNRQTVEDLRLFDGVRATEPHLRYELQISRQSARPKKSKKKARPKRAERTATMALRYQSVELRPRRSKDEPIPLWIIHTAEENPPAGVEPIEWFLLTTMNITSPELAERLVRYYCLRWRIEDWHRVLKSGCRIEKLRNESAERLERAIAIYLVIAWHVMLMTLLGREVPDLPPDVLFSDIELEVLERFAKSRRDLKPPTRLGDAVNLVGRLGGNQGQRKTPPGHQALWIGYTKLGAMCEGALLFRSQPP